MINKRRLPEDQMIFSVDELKQQVFPIIKLTGWLRMECC